MQFRARSFVRILSLLVLIAVTNVYVFASGTITGSGNNVSALLGKLITNSNRPISVNGGDAITGTIILSGAQLVTPVAAGATVQLEKLGTVMVAPSSSVTLTFDLKNVTVNVASGHAAVTTLEGVKGTVFGPDGKTVAGSSSLPSSAPDAAGDAKNWGIAGVAIGSAAFIWALIAWNKANSADDKAAAAAAAAAAAQANLAAQLAALRACLAAQRASPVVVCTTF